MQPQARPTRLHPCDIRACGPRGFEVRRRADEGQAVSGRRAPTDTAAQGFAALEPHRVTQQGRRACAVADMVGLAQRRLGRTVVARAEQQAAVEQRQHVAAAGHRHARRASGGLQGPAHLAAPALQPRRGQAREPQRIVGIREHDDGRAGDHLAAGIDRLPLGSMAQEANDRSAAAPAQQGCLDGMAHEARRVDPAARRIEPGGPCDRQAGDACRLVGIDSLHMARRQRLPFDDRLHRLQGQPRFEPQQAVDAPGAARIDRLAHQRLRREGGGTQQPRMGPVLAHHRAMEQAGRVARRFGGGFAVSVDQLAGDALARDRTGGQRAGQAGTDHQRVARRRDRQHAAWWWARAKARREAGLRDPIRGVRGG